MCMNNETSPPMPLVCSTYPICPLHRSSTASKSRPNDPGGKRSWCTLHYSLGAPCRQPSPSCTAPFVSASYGHLRMPPNRWVPRVAPYRDPSECGAATGDRHGYRSRCRDCAEDGYRGQGGTGARIATEGRVPQTLTCVTRVTRMAATTPAMVPVTITPL